MSLDWHQKMKICFGKQVNWLRVCTVREMFEEGCGFNGEVNFARLVIRCKMGVHWKVFITSNRFSFFERQISGMSAWPAFGVEARVEVESGNSPGRLGKMCANRKIREIGRKKYTWHRRSAKHLNKSPEVEIFWRRDVWKTRVYFCRCELLWGHGNCVCGQNENIWSTLILLLSFFGVPINGSVFITRESLMSFDSQIGARNIKAEWGLKKNKRLIDSSGTK